MRTIIVAFTAIFLAASPLQAEIREVCCMDKALATADKDTLLVFDLDNTIMRTVQMLGSDQWFDSTVKKFEVQGMARQAAVARAIVLWEETQRVTEMVPVESRTPALIEEAQKRGIKTLALTARTVTLADVTKRQLAKIGVDFSRSAVLNRDLTIHLKSEARYRSGMLFVGPANDKGSVLKRFLEVASFSPKRIIFVDDKVHHLRDVEAALKGTSIRFSGFRYGAADSEVGKFDPAVADVELRYFGQILSDEAARAIMRAQDK